MTKKEKDCGVMGARAKELASQIFLNASINSPLLGDHSFTTYYFISIITMSYFQRGIKPPHEQTSPFAWL